MGKSRSVVERMRKKIVGNGEGGLHALMRVLRMMDEDGDDSLSRDELKRGLLDLGVEVSLSDLENVMISFDKDHSGTISFAEFVDGIRGELSPLRLGYVERAFDLVEDPVGSGATTVGTCIAELERLAAASSTHADDLLDGDFDEMAQGNQDAGDNAVIEWESFLDYYRTTSAAIDGDRRFVALMESAWGTGVHEPAPALPRAASRKSSKASAFRAASSRGGSRANRRRASKAQQQGGDSDDALAAFRKGKKRPDLARNEGIIRLRAAARLQAVFRGHKGRHKVDYERRKKVIRQAQLDAERKEREREANRVKRTQPKHNPRFAARRR